MDRLAQLASKLTPSQLREVEDFAEFLSTRPPATELAPKKISFEGWAGCLAHVDPTKSDKQIIREAWDEIVAKYD